MQGKAEDVLEGFDPTYIIISSVCPMIEQSSTSLMIPKARIPYIVNHFPAIRAQLAQYNVEIALDLKELQLVISTTNKMTDPSTYLLAKQYANLISRSFSVEEAALIFQPNTECEIFKLRAPQAQLTKRRTRFAGPNGQTLKALALLTNTRVALTGKTLAVIGSPNGIDLMGKIYQECFEKNVHPVKWVKGLMIRRELQKIKELENEDWSKFFPKDAKKNFKKRRTTIQQKKKGVIIDVGKFTERKEDYEMLQGVYKRKNEQERK